MTPSFEEANKKIHKVEDQWHFPILTKFGFKPIQLEAVGFVRSYRYEHPNGRVIVCTTGVNSDRWEEMITQDKLRWGYWSELEKHLSSEIYS